MNALRIDVFALFPELVDGFASVSLLGKARTAGLLDLRCHDIRAHTTDVHRTVDDTPFGGEYDEMMAYDFMSLKTDRFFHSIKHSSENTAEGSRVNKAQADGLKVISATLRSVLT